MKVEANGWWDDGMARDEELDNMLSSILDFPMESLEGDDWDTTNSLHLGPIPMDVLFQAPDQPPNWFGDGAENKSAHARSHSPVSVLETTVSSKSLLFKSGIVKRARSKRARPSGVSPWLLLPPVFADANKTKERRKKSPCLPMAKQTMESSDCTAQARPTKKCTHCEITKTPQWREGPLGPKTLCNACGVRYRSGRLFPEYRPVASPTFVPSLHSNSHKKVIEMRNKGKHRVAEVC